MLQTWRIGIYAAAMSRVVGNLCLGVMHMMKVVSYRSCCKPWLMLVVVATAASARPATGWAQGLSSANPAIKVDLRTTLEKGLRCRRPQEFAYIATIVDMVESGELPETLVRNLYGWARRRQGYPLQSFQIALSRQAARLGIQDVPTIERNNVNLTSGP